MKRESFAAQVLDYYFTLQNSLELPEDIETIFPFRETETARIMRIFYEKYYNDTAGRSYLFGINPGRFGAGITGIGFSDGLLLEKHCEIPNNFEKRSELSAEFIFEVIETYGGPTKFYNDFYITSTSPIGFIKAGKNYNYYDEKPLQHAVDTFILDSVQRQLAFGQRHKDIICVGQGKNLKYLQKLNQTHHLFGEIHTVPHPRWVMQYRRKEKEKHIAHYLQVLEKFAN